MKKLEAYWVQPLCLLDHIAEILQLHELLVCRGRWVGVVRGCQQSMRLQFCHQLGFHLYAHGEASSSAGQDCNACSTYQHSRALHRSVQSILMI